MEVLNILTIIMGFGLGYLIPATTTFFSEDKSEFKKLILGKSNILLNLLSSLSLGIIVTFVSIQTSPSSTEDIIGILLTLLISFGLLFLVVEDLKSMEISVAPTLTLLVLTFVINMALVVSSNNQIALWEANVFDANINLIGGFSALFFTGAVFLITKGKGIGFGDVLLAGIIGFILGWQRLIVAFYIIIISASVVGIAIGVKKGKIRGTRIPFVPFIVIGAIITFLMWPQLHELISGYFVL